MSNTIYLSQEKFEELKRELENRKNVIRKDIAEKIGIAKDQGDLSENFEYQTAKDMQAENEGEIFKLENMLHQAVIVEQEKGGDTVRLGATFIVEMPNGEEKEFQLVGASETDPMQGKISNESPLGNAFVGAKKGQEVTITMPTGTMKYIVTDIK